MRSAPTTGQNSMCEAACTAPARGGRRNRSTANGGRRHAARWPGSQKCVHAARRSWAEAADTARPGLFQDLRAHPSSRATPNKTAAISSVTGNKGNCYVAYEYKYTRSLAVEWTSVPFHRRSLNSGVTCQSIDYLCVCLSWLLLWPRYKLSNF